MARTSIRLACWALCAALGATPALAAAKDQYWLAASDHKLDNMRGGFSLGQGLTVSFGIVRTVEINGAVVASSSFRISDLRSIDPAQAAQLASQAASMNLVQNGPGNVFNVTPQSGLPALVIQNTLNDQKIRTVTQIDAVTNGMSLLKGLNISQTLNDALGAAAGR